MYSEDVPTSWLCHSVDTSCLCIYSKGPLVTSYEAMITLMTSDGLVAAFHFHVLLYTSAVIIMSHLHSWVEIEHYVIAYFITAFYRL